MRGVGDGLDQAVGRRLVDHPLHELTAERLRAPHLGDRQGPLRAQEIQDGAHADGQAFDRLVQLHLAAHAPVQGPQYGEHLVEAGARSSGGSGLESSGWLVSGLLVWGTETG